MNLLVLDVAFVLLLAAFACLIWSGFRNNAVYNFRIRLIRSIGIGCPLFWQRFAAFNEVTYDEMMWPLWKPLEAYYGDEKLRLICGDKYDQYVSEGKIKPCGR